MPANTFGHSTTQIQLARFTPTLPDKHLNNCWITVTFYTFKVEINLYSDIKMLEKEWEGGQDIRGNSHNIHTSNVELELFVAFGHSHNKIYKWNSFNDKDSWPTKLITFPSVQAVFLVQC